MSFPGNINLNNLASLMASAGGAGAYPGFNAAAMAAAAASQPAADGAASGVPAAAAAADADITMINTIEKNLYHDNSRVTPADVDANPRARRANSKREPTFPMKLHQMLSDLDAEGVVVWLPHGRAWKIINQDKFETGLLGKYFEHGNMSSFMRQVNGWDFRRVVKGVDEQSYYHEVRFRLCLHVCRSPSASRLVGRVLFSSGIAHKSHATPCAFFSYRQIYPLLARSPARHVSHLSPCPISPSTVSIFDLSPLPPQLPSHAYSSSSAVCLIFAVA